MTHAQTGSEGGPSQGGTQDSAPDASGSEGFKVRVVGIHGARNTGKTCYLACLYGRQAVEDAALTFEDAQSIEGLKAAWETLQNGDVPDATALTVPTDIRMNLHSEGNRWKLLTHDYAGALVQRSDSGETQLEREVKDWLLASDAVLVFVGVDTWLSEDDSDARERQAELDLFLNGLIEMSAEQNTVARPLALVLTKWDMVGSISDDPAAEQERAREFLEERATSETMAGVMEQVGDRFNVFPVSSFGRHRRGNLPPADGPEPFNLHAPLVWAVQAADEALFSEARRRVRGLVDSRRWWKRYGPAVKEYENLIDKRGINSGPIYQEIRRALKPLKHRLHKRCLVIILALVALVLAALYVHAQLRYESVRAIVDNATQHPDRVSEAVEAYVKSLNPMASLLRRKKDIQSRRDKAFQNRMEHEFAELKDFRERYRSEHKAAERYQRCATFLDRWPNSPHAAAVESWGREDELERDVFKDKVELRQDVERLKSRVRQLGEDHEAIVAECNEVLDRHRGANSDSPEFQEAQDIRERHQTALEDLPWYEAKESAEEKAAEGDYTAAIKLLEAFEREYPTSDRIADADKLIPEYRSLREDKAWREIVVYERDNPGNHDRIIDMCHAYLNATDMNHRSEAEDLVAKHERLWDQELYEGVQDLARRAKGGKSIEGARKKAEEYLARTSPPRNAQAEQEVKEFLNWFHALSPEPGASIRTCAITVEWVRVPDGSALSGDRWGKPEFYVMLRLGAKEIRTQESKPADDKGDYYQADINEELAGFPLAWGEHDSLVVTVIEDDGGRGKSDDGNEYEEVEVREEERPHFVLGRANGEITIHCEKGEEITVMLKCPDARPPVLAPYPPEQ
ncbi:MAG: TRAFAC clade GTPase domain-containing protein [Planctomycetota bacterium]